MPFSKCTLTSISLFIQTFADGLQKTLNPADRSNWCSGHTSATTWNSAKSEGTASDECA